MIRKIAFITLVGAFTAFADDALPKADTILDHYIEVTGGKAAYEKRKSEITTGTVEFAAQGLKGSMTHYAAAPDKSYTVIELDGIGKMEEGVINGTVWDKNPMLGPRVKSGDEKAQGLRGAMFNSHLNWRKVYSKVETTAVETVEGEECYKVVLTPNDGKPETAYFSKKTGLEIKRSTTAVSPMGEMQVEAVAANYKDFDGVMEPTKLIQRVAGQELVMTIQSIKVNPEIPAEKFEPPAEVKALINKK
jgi:outer membrane lipoprotein-sorting protein